MPKFCVVIPSYNSASTIFDAVKSAVDLDYPDYSVVVSDNVSKDDTVSIANGINSPRLKVFSNDVLLRKSENWNRAYSQADDCEYFVNLHSDDVLSKDVLRYLDKAIASDVVLIHGADYRISFDNTEVIKRRHYPFKYTLSGDTQRRLLLLGNCVSIVGTAIKRDAFQSLGGWSLDYDFYQDVELWYKLASLGRNVYVPEKFGFYRAPATDNPERSVDETLRWYEDKIKSGLGEKLEKAAVNSLKRIANNNLSSHNTFSEELTQKLLDILNKYDRYPKYLLGTYVQTNLVKLSGYRPA